MNNYKDKKKEHSLGNYSQNKTKFGYLKCLLLNPSPSSEKNPPVSCLQS